MIYVTVPVHNERHTIGVLLWKVRKVLTELGRDFRILVADDASTDETAEILEPYRRVLPLTVIRSEERRGYAPSLETLVREAVARSDYPRRDSLVVLQADFTDAPEVIPEMLRWFEGGADLVAGVESGSRAVPRSVRWARLGASFLSQRLPTPPELEDPLCGFRMYRLFVLKRSLAEADQRGRPLLSRRGWAANAELLAAVWPHVRQWEQVEFPRDYSRRYRESRFRPVPELWEIFRAGGGRRARGGEGEREAETGAGVGSR